MLCDMIVEETLKLIKNKMHHLFKWNNLFSSTIIYEHVFVAFPSNLVKLNHLFQINLIALKYKLAAAMPTTI